jgi:uncharacterized protein (TIRG00374 family)
MKRKSLIGIVISAVLLFLVFRNVNVAEFKQAMREANYLYVIPVVGLALLSLWIRAVRWRFLLLPVKGIRLGRLYSATMIGFMANNLLPARLGEFVRAYVLGTKENVSKSSCFATIVVERIFDGITLLLFLSVVLTFYSFSSPKWIYNAAYAVIAGYVLVILFLVILKTRTRDVIRITEKLFSPFPEKAGRVVIATLQSFVEGLKILQSLPNILLSFLFSLLVWIPHIFLIHLLLKSVGIELSYSVAIVVLAGLGLGMVLPSAPGYVGTVQFVCVASLALYAVPKSQALSFSIIYHASTFIPVTIVGLAYLAVEGMSLREIRSSAEINSQAKSVN